MSRENWVDRQKRYKEILNDVEQFLKQNFSSVSFDELITVLSMASGPLRGPYMEKWFVDNNFYSSKVSAKEGRGDLTNGIVFDELKVRFLKDKEIKKGKAHSAGQIRLWENIDNYLFITVNLDKLDYSIFYIPKEIYKQLVLSNTVRFSSSHIKGNSSLLKENPDMVNQLEISSELNYKDYNWDSFKISLSELRNKLI